MLHKTFFYRSIVKKRFFYCLKKLNCIIVNAAKFTLEKLKTINEGSLFKHLKYFSEKEFEKKKVL